MKKIQRQERFSISHPPSTGPSAAVIAVKPDHVPMARPRSAGGNDALMSARLPGTSSAAPTPCRARAATSSANTSRHAAPCRGDSEQDDTGGEGLTAASGVAHRSAGQEEGGQREGIGFDHPLHARQRGVEDDCRAGRATFTTVLSMKARLEPRIVAASTHRPPGAGAQSASPARMAASSHGSLPTAVMPIRF